MLHVPTDKASKKIYQPMFILSFYLLVVDKYSRYLWLFAFVSKYTPVKNIKQFLNTYGIVSGPKWEHANQRGELVKLLL